MSLLRKTLLAAFLIVVLGAPVPLHAAGALPLTVTIQAPSELKAVSGYGKIVLTWKDNSESESGFLIERSLGPDDYYPVDHVDANVETYTDTGEHYMLHPNELYYYRVRAFKGSIQSAPSNTTEGNYYYTEEPLPAWDLEAEPLQYNRRSFKLSWETPHNLNTSYYLQTSVNGGLFVTGGSPVNQKYTYISKEDMSPGSTYTYRILARNVRGESYSNQVSVSLPHLPALPADFKATAQGGPSVKLTWTDKSNNEDGFLIYRKKLNESYSFTPHIATGPNVQEYLDTGLEAATWYCYTICPFNGNNQTGAASDIKVLTAPYAPTYFSATRLSDNTVQLYWNNRTKVTKVNIERKTAGGEWTLIEEYIMLPPVPASCYYNDTSTLPGTTYTYRCYAVLIDLSGNVTSEPSEEASVTTSGDLVRLPALDGKKVIRFNLGKAAYTVDGQALSMDAAPVSNEGRTMLPIKYVTDPLGATLTWDGTDKKVTIEKGSQVIELWIGNNIARINGAERAIDPDNPNVRPYIAPPGRTMLPLRFISESLGCTVEWDPMLKEARLTYGDQ